MPSPTPGPRDHLITRSLERELEDLDDDLRDEAPLDAAEAPERLARHAMGEIRRELEAAVDVSIRRPMRRPSASTP